MDCPKCGGKMEKGCIVFACWDRVGLDYHIDWYYDKSIEKYSKFPKSLLVKPDLKFGAKRYKMGRYGLTHISVRSAAQ